MTVHSICDQRLAAMHVRYIIPLVVGGIVNGEDVMDDIAEYTLQDIMSEFEPDEALMALALSCQHIAAHTGDHVMGRALKIEAAKIIDDYAPVILAHEAGQIASDDPQVADLMMNVPEDLECLGDLLMALSGAIIDETRAIIAILCDILADQAEIHREYAEYQLNELDLGTIKTLIAAERKETARMAAAPGKLADNVIPFPLGKRFA